MSSKDCSHVWSELLIAAKAFRRTIRPAFTVQPQNIVQRALKLHPPSQPFGKRPSHWLDVTLDPQDRRRSESLGCFNGNGLVTKVPLCLANPSEVDLLRVFSSASKSTKVEVNLNGRGHHG